MSFHTERAHQVLTTVGKIVLTKAHHKILELWSTEKCSKRFREKELVLQRSDLGMVSEFSIVLEARRE